MRARSRPLGLTLAFHQSNHEGELVDLIQSARQTADAIIINPAAYSFTSIAMVDAIKAFEGPVLEVHISNIHARDEYHRHSKISHAATAVICGLGPYGYIAALRAVAEMPKGVTFVTARSGSLKRDRTGSRVCSDNGSALPLPLAGGGSGSAGPAKTHWSRG